MKPLPNNKQDTCSVDTFLLNYFHQLTNSQLAIKLGMKLSTLRTRCYALGLKRMELEYFTEEQTAFLINNYQTFGDCELAEIFARQWPKAKGWTKKHIEKKRKYMGLKRTEQQIKAIHDRNVKNGRYALCPVKAWQKRGVAQEGEIRYWTNRQTGRPVPVIKHEGRFIHWVRWVWEQHFGPIPKGANVVFKDGNPYNLAIANLHLLSNSDLARQNAQKSSRGLSNGFIAGILTHKDPALRKQLLHHPEILEIKRKQLILKRALYGNKHHQNTSGRHGK